MYYNCHMLISPASAGGARVPTNRRAPTCHRASHHVSIGLHAARLLVCWNNGPHSESIGAAASVKIRSAHVCISPPSGYSAGSLAMIAIFFGSVAVNAMNDYTGSLSLLAAGVRIWRPISAAIVGVLSFIATLWLYYNNFLQSFENYLLLITYWIGPWIAIVLVDWRLRRGRFDVRRVTPFANLPSGWNALIALVIGFVASIPFFNQSYFVGPLANGTDVTYVVGFVVAAVVYWVLERRASTAVPATA